MSIAATAKSDKDFANKVSDTLIVRKGLPLEGLTYSVNESADYYADNLKIENGTYIFDVMTPTEIIRNVEFNLPGKHNVLNAVAAFAMANSYEISLQVIAKALLSFKGITRRFSYKIKNENPAFIFAGMQSGENLAQYYASSDIFIFPSMTETFGNVVLEAMASGLGVIAYDYAAASTHIYPGENGQLAYFGNSSEFTDKACGYLNNYLLLQRIQMNASKYARGQSWKNIVQQFESILYKHV